MAFGAHSISEFDVFNRGSRITFCVETVNCEKHITANRATAGPESFSFTTCLLVYETVKEVLVLRNEVFLRRFVIVGAKHCRYFRVVHKVCRDSFKRVWLYNDIRIDKEKHFATRVLSTKIARASWP